MYNIMKSQLYQLRRDKLMWGIILVVFIMTPIMSLENFEYQTSGSEMVATTASLSSIINSLISLVVVANVMGKDFMDKTLNYEILSGHSRKEVFFGRMLVAILVAPILTTLSTLSVPVLLSCLYGWGNSMNLSGVLIRYALLYINHFRVACEIVFITIIVKNAYLSYLVCYMGAMVQIFFTTMTMHYEVTVTPLLSLYHGYSLLHFEDWQTFYIDEQDQIFYSSETSLEMIITTLLLTILVGGLLTLISYYYFKHDDLN